MIIKEEHISEAEKLLINGAKFDSEERVPFIKNLNSCDLLAVPGSGKTTALLAKLYCISKNLPFQDGSGILVLSHTNAAVDEIENILKKFCPIIFEYPNFVGTVQSFVNKFLANQACFEKYGTYIRNNDDDLICKKIVSKIGNNSKLFYFINRLLRHNENIEDIISSVRYGKNSFTSDRFNKKKLSFTSESGKILKKIFDELRNNGDMFYCDSFELADSYLEKYLLIKEILHHRFKYVFIDEMQDLEKFQIDIIDKIFLGEGSTTVIQRIGDINQSIYNSGKKVKVEADWQPRNQLYLKGSNRLTPEIANIVNSFTLDRQLDEEGNPRFIVNGLRQLDVAINPYMILFDNQTIGVLENKFKELIRDYSLQETKEAEKYGFKIIGWSAKWDDDEDHDGKLRLENIFETYRKESKGSKETFDSLSRYLQLFDHDKTTLEAARKAVLNSLIHVLRIENKTYKTKIRGRDVLRDYSKNEMIKYIHNSDNNCNYDFFKKGVYGWSFELATRRKYEEVYESLKAFINGKFSEWFGFSISNKTVSFLGDSFEQLLQSDDNQSENTSDNSIKLDIGTVHSAKGQTHCATMYVETAYQRPTYESEKIVKRDSNPMLLQEHKCTGSYDRQALKMMYVGFSRPTHLLCFACLKDNAPLDQIANYKSVGWEVIDLTEMN